MTQARAAWWSRKRKEVSSWTRPAAYRLSRARPDSAGEYDVPHATLSWRHTEQVWHLQSEARPSRANEGSKLTLCSKHYGEYLVSLINAHSLDPALLYDAHDLIRTCERHHVDTQRADNEDDDAYHARLRKVKSLNASRQSCFFCGRLNYEWLPSFKKKLKYDTNDFLKWLSL